MAEDEDPGIQGEELDETSSSAVDDGGLTVDEALAAAGDDVLEFARGDALTRAEVAVLATEVRPTVIVFAGGVGSGKTTMIVSLYERFGRGPVAGLLFAGSRTLPGLEFRCQPGRVEFGSDSFEMLHTPRDALPWLHIRIRDATRSSPAQDLVFGDFYGEHFEDLIAGRVEPHELPFLRRADHLCIVVDGEKLSSPVYRRGEVQKTADLLTVLIRPGVLAAPTVLSLVITKLDMWHRADSADQGDADRAADDLLNQIYSQYPDVEIPLIRVAARSTISEFPLGHGLDALLEMWARQPAIHISHPPPGPALNRLGPFDAFRA